MRHWKKFLFFTIVMYTKTFSASQKKLPLKTDVLFLFYDAGETLGLEPVVSNLAKGSVLTQVVALGTSRDRFYQNKPYVDVNTTCGWKSNIDAKNWQREQDVPSADLQKWAACIQAKVLVTGVVSKAQFELAKILKANGTKIIAFYDGYAYTPNPTTERFFTVADSFLVPSDDVAQKLSKFIDKQKIHVVGQPSLLTWVEGSKKLGAREPLLQTIVSHKKFHKDDKILLYVGGYEGGYKEAFKLFAESLKVTPSYHALISLHPKSDGAFEKNILHEMKIKNAEVLEKHVSTMEAVYVSDIVVTQRSTAGIQALFIGKPVIYVDTDHRYRNFFIEKELASQVITTESFKDAVQRALEEKKEKKSVDMFLLSGIPKNPVELMTQEIKRNLL